MQFVVRRASGFLALLVLMSATLLMPPPARAMAVPGYNGRIAFTRHVGPYGTDANGTYTVNSDGSGEVQLTHTTGVFGAYSNDGAQIAYLDTGGISLMNADGSNKHVLVPGATTGLRMAWSPDGTLFASMRSPGPDGINIIHADGSGTNQILVGDPGDSWYPAWSPDGTQLVFWDQYAHCICTINPDGTNRRVVVATTHAVTWPTFSPDGTKLVWGDRDSVAGTPEELYVANADGSNAQSIGGGNDTQPAVSPDSGWVAYSHGGDASEGIWVMRIDGSDAHQVTHGSDGFPDWQPLQMAPSRYNGRIALVRSGELYTAYPDGTGLTDLHLATGWWPSWTNDGRTIGVATAGAYTTMAADGSATAPRSTTAGPTTSLSPDGTHLTFSRSVAGDLDDVFVSDLDGSNEIDIVARPGPDYFPVWAPDSKQIAFMGGDETGRHIWIVNADGTNLHEVLNQPAGYAGLPRFSPDGTRLLFGVVQDSSDQTAEWFVIGTDGSNLLQVGPTNRYVNDASFSPDGTKIVFSSFAPGWAANSALTDLAAGLYVMKADGTNVVQITRGNDVWASWQPLMSPPPNLSPRARCIVQNKLPRALFANGDASFDSDGTIVSYEWRWGDYSAMTPHKYAWHKYASPGTYFVRLTVTDNDGAKTTKKAWIKVN